MLAALVRATSSCASYHYVWDVGMSGKHELLRVRRADVTPHASALIEGLRDIGYSLETALADIVDNSITVGARRIQLLTDTFSDEPFIAILDDGTGMTEDELVAAMRPGSRNPRGPR